MRPFTRQGTYFAGRASKEKPSETPHQPPFVLIDQWGAAGRPGSGGPAVENTQLECTKVSEGQQGKMTLVGLQEKIPALMA